MSNVVESLAVEQRRKSRRAEFAMQLAEMLAKYLDPRCVFWSGLENAPRSPLSGLLQKRRGIRAGLPDLIIIFRDPLVGFMQLVFVELKSQRGAASKVQKQIFAELRAVGAHCWLARSARATLMALHLSGVPFRRQWKPPRLAAWEGPFNDVSQRLPQHPEVARQRRAAQQRWRQRAREAAKREAGRDGATAADTAG